MTTPTTIFISLFAVWEGYEDHLDIKAGKRIEHKAGWKYRAIVALIVELLIMYVTEAPFMQFLLCYVLSAPLFSAVFRFALNKWRGLDWRYMGRRMDDRTKDDSDYDTFWHQLAWFFSGKGHMYLNRNRRCVKYPRYDLRTPGTLATVVEAVAFVVLTVLAVFVH